MKNVDMIALAGLMHDIGKFGQRAQIELRGDFNKNIYGYRHSNYTAQILKDYFNDIQNYHQASFEHHIVDKNSDISSWIIATADRLASGFERDEFIEYNAQKDNENFKTQRLWGIFEESKKYKIAKFDIKNIFYAQKESIENEYKDLWDKFERDLVKLRESNGNQTTDLTSLDYLLKRYTSFIPSSTSFRKGVYEAVKANIPLYDHSKATAIFACVIDKLDKQKQENLINYYKKDVAYQETNEFILINGDFFGIQDFIFNDMEAKNASKILRGKSAFVQILTKIVALHIVEELELSHLSIISENAGKFEILAPNSDDVKDKLKNIQQELNDYFIKEFFGQTGVGISYVECGLFDFIEKGKYKILRDEMAKEVELAKLNKFNLTNCKYEMEWKKELNNQNQCFACKKRVGIVRKDVDKKVCDSCYRFIKIGKNLVKAKYLVITKDRTDIQVFGDYFLKFLSKKENPKGLKNTVAIYDISKDIEFSGYAKWELSSYVKFSENEDRIEEFEELALESCKGEVDGIKALMSLKGDVDGMGNFLRDEKNGISNSFAKFNFFSRLVDYYFSVYVPYLMREKYQNTYTVFAGGDDLFVLGAWDEVIELAKDIRKDFIRFSCKKLTISMGMVLTKPNKPVNFIARVSEERLEEAKEHKEDGEEKDAIALFDEVVKWDDYLDDNGLMEDLKIVGDNTSFLYRVLEFIDLSKKVKNGDMKATIWKSKLNYLAYRNLDMGKKVYQNLVNNLNEMIEKYPQETKMFLSEFVYKRRKA